MVYLRALSGARRDRLQTPLKSVVGADFCGFATPAFSVVCANKMDEQTSAAIATIELTSRLRILKLPGVSDSCRRLNSIASALLIRVILTALHPILFAVGQHDFAETHGMRTISRAISYHCNLVARLE